MKKTKILFVINSLSIGGIQKSLIELVNEVCDQYDISVYCVEGKGCLQQKLDSSVEYIIGSSYASIPESSSSHLLKERKYFSFVFRILLVVLTRLGLKPIAVRLYLYFMPEIKGQYDIAISYSQPLDDRSFTKLSNEIVLYRCNSKKKATFVHCDFENYGGNTAYNRKLYHHFDMVVAVSNSVGNVIKKCANLPNEKVVTVYNICNSERIIELSKERPQLYNKFCFLIVARLTKEKGIERVVSCCKRLKREGYSFELHIVGNGNLRVELQCQISNCGLEGVAILQGEQINPYRFMKNANCIIVPSYHEAAPMVFLEALTLGIPIITTNTLSAEEIVGTRGGGVICENNAEAIYNSMKAALDNGIVTKTTDSISVGRLGVVQFKSFAECLLKEND